MSDHYETLGIPRDASAEDVRRAYRQQASKAHPDKGGTDAEMADVNRAFACLIDASARERYDKTGSDDKPSTERDAVALIGTMLAELVSEAEHAVRSQDDLVHIMGAKVSNITTICEGHIKKAKRELSAIRRLSKRMTGPVEWEAVIKERLRMVAASIDKAEYQIEVNALVIKRLREFKDRPPAKRERPDADEGQWWPSPIKNSRPTTSAT